MPERILAQSAPSANTLTTIYTVPSGTLTVISSITVCNRSAVATTFRLSTAIAGAADAVAQYIYYDVPLPGNDTFVASLGLTLAAGDVVRVFVGAATVSIHLYGAEVP